MSERSARATNADVLIAAISQHPGATDGELRIITGIEPHQQVNQVCRRLEQQGRVDRRTRDDGRIGNFPLGTPPTDPAAGEDPAIVTPRRSSKVTDTATGTAVAGPVSLPPPESALIILPCSKAKKRGGRPGERWIADHHRSVAARASNETHECPLSRRAPGGRRCDSATSRFGAVPGVPV